MYDTTITLRSVAITYDDYGNELETCTDREVFAVPRGVYNSEFYRAAQVGLHPTMTFVLTNREDYDGEQLLIYDDKVYAVIRVDWKAQRDRVELVCEEKIGLRPEREDPDEEEHGNGEEGLGSTTP